MSDMAEGAQTAPEASTTETPQQGAPTDALMARIDEMSQQLGKLVAEPAPDFQGGLSDVYAEGAQSDDVPFEQGYQDYEQDGYQPGQYQPEYGTDPAQAQQQAMQQLQSYITEQVQQGIQQNLTPHLQRQRANELERQYPDLADPQKAAKVVQATAQYAQRMGRPELARDPELVELVYLAEQARNSAAQETPADGGQSVHLESGGAAPQQPEEDAGDRMLRAWGIDPAAA